MAKVHVISATERNVTGGDLVDQDVNSLWGNTSKLCKDVWFYLIILNLVMGIIFIIMDVTYYDSCLEGDSPNRAVPAFLFLIGISQMALSVIIPAFMYFMKNKNLHVVIRIPVYETKKNTSVLFAGLVVAISFAILLLFVILGLAFASSTNRCHSSLVLFTQIVCSVYIIGFLIVITFLTVKKKHLPSIGQISENNRNEYSKSDPPPSEDLKVEESPFQDNLSEVNLSDSHQVEHSKPKHLPIKMAPPSTEFMLARYICVVSGVIWLISAVPGIPILALGATYHGRCSKYLNVPIWLIVQGSVLLFGAAALVGGWCGGRGKQTKRRLVFLIPAAIIIIFLLIWPIVGVAWSDQTRTALANDKEKEKVEDMAGKEDCGRNFVTGVLITSAVYAIPFFILGYILCILLLSLLVGITAVVVIWSLHEGPQ